MSKKFIIIGAIILIAVAGGLFAWRVQDNRVKAEKTQKVEAEIVKGLTAEEIELILKSQAVSDGATIEFITQTPETRQAFLKGLKEHLALAAQARREGLTEDQNFKINFEYKKNILLADLYRAKLAQEQGKPYLISDDEAQAVWSNSPNEKQFETDMNTMQAIQKAVAEVRGHYFVPGKLQGESLEKARARWARMKALSDKARADAEFMQKPEVNLRIKVLEAGILSEDYLRKHWAQNIRATEPEINAFLASNPQYDLTKKRQKAESILQRAKAGEDFANLAKWFTEHRPSKNTGGLVENVKKGDWMPELEVVVLGLEKGQIAANLIETELGYHIVKLENKQTIKDNSGAETVQYSFSHILLQNKFEEPNVVNPDLPPPFLKAEEIAKTQVEKEKRNQFVESIIRQTQINLPQDFNVKLSAGAEKSAS
jgi:hypothetical protein